MDIKTQGVERTLKFSSISKKPVSGYLFDILVILLMGGLLYFGASWQIFKTYTDAARYQCYALAFWQGMPALHLLPASQCSFMTKLDTGVTLITRNTIVQTMQHLGFPTALVQFVAAQSPALPYHALPHEYPLLTLLPFTPALLGPLYWYQVIFAVCMALFVAAIYLLLVRFHSRKAALACALYLIVGAWATALGRFDLIPSLLTLLALFCAVRARWNWSFALLALATLFKFYPAVLVVPFLIAQQRTQQGKWYALRRWGPLGVFVLVCIVVVVASLLLSVENTLAPLAYFGSRPVQVESLPASLLWLLSLLVKKPLTYGYTFGSLNMYSPFSSAVSLGVTILTLGGVLYTWWLQWRARIDLAIASLLTLLVIIATGKVFSPQYLIWVVPLVAYVGGMKVRWLIPWLLIGALTTWIYPYIYITVPGGLMFVPYDGRFFAATTARNILLLGFVLSLLISYSCKRPVSE